MKNKNNMPLPKAPIPDERFAVHRKNIIWILAGLLLMVLGYILMIGGGTKDPNVFTGDQMFSFRRIVLAPILIFAGFVFEIWAIMHKKRAE
jgi:hypothetical protein